MRALAPLALLILLAPLAAQAQPARGTVREGLTINSQILGKPVRYTVYLPYDYETSTRYYPVVYLLHGHSGQDTDWVQYGEANLMLDEAIAERRIPPMIVVMPDAENSWYVNAHDGAVRYEDFFFVELMPSVEQQFRIRQEKQFRGIAGLSMGGHGTLLYALRRPELFAAAAPLSAGVFTDEEVAAMPQDWWDRLLGPVFGPGLEGQARLAEHLRHNSPMHLIRADPAAAKQVRWYIDNGDDDFLFKGNATLHILLRDLEIPHQFRVRDGGHNWTYWRTGLPDALAFIGASFHRE